VEATRDWSRTWRISLVTDLRVWLGCFGAIHVPGQTARFRGFTKRDKQNGRQNRPITFELHSCHSIAGPTGNLIACFSRVQHYVTARFAFFAFDLRHNGRAKAKATANKVELLDLQGAYRSWSYSLPANVADSATAEALRAICEIDLTELNSVEPPRGFGRDS
jgi:hypothetical protein